MDELEEISRRTDNSSRDNSPEEIESQQKPDYEREIIDIIRSNDSPRLLRDKLEDYHENDIAAILSRLTLAERKRLYRILSASTLSEIFEYSDEEEASQYLNEMDAKKAAAILSELETDTALDILREIEKEKRALLIELMDVDSRNDIRMIASFDEDEIGSRMTTNCIIIRDNLTVKEAMTELIAQAGTNDNISTL
ncbi:MAG: magnesium transporter, partial [Blautia sp.]|nr:magnesium transporter [Blautia sp.]